MKYVDDDLEIIENDPLARRKPINGSSGNPMIFFEPRFDFAGDRFQMRLRCRRTDHEEIGERGDFTKIENNNLFRFLVRREIGAGCG